MTQERQGKCQSKVESNHRKRMSYTYPSKKLRFTSNSKYIIYHISYLIYIYVYINSNFFSGIKIMSDTLKWNGEQIQRTNDYKMANH